jgi:hypothetical protein
MLLYVVGIVVVGLSFFILRVDPPPVANVYQQPGKFYHIKYWLFYAMMSLRKRRSKQQQHVSGKDAGYGMRSRSSVDDMECVQPLPKEHPLVGNIADVRLICVLAAAYAKLYVNS